ncbi:MAG: hypothetical protein WCK05_04670 [Planctomycetota bacterium]
MAMILTTSCLADGIGPTGTGPVVVSVVVEVAELYHKLQLAAK